MFYFPYFLRAEVLHSDEVEMVTVERWNDAGMLGKDGQLRWENRQ